MNLADPISRNLVQVSLYKIFLSGFSFFLTAMLLLQILLLFKGKMAVLQQHQKDKLPLTNIHLFILRSDHLFITHINTMWGLKPIKKTHNIISGLHIRTGCYRDSSK